MANSPWHERNSLLKGMGEETLIGLLHIMHKTHPLLIKRIKTTLLDHAPGALTVSSHLYTSKSGFRNALSVPALHALDHALRSLK